MKWGLLNISIWKIVLMAYLLNRMEVFTLPTEQRRWSIGLIMFVFSVDWTELQDKLTCWWEKHVKHKHN